MVPQNIWNKLLPSLYLNRHCDKSSLCPSCRIKAFSGQIPLKLLLWFNRQIMTDRQSYFRNKLKWMVLYNLKETKYPVKVIISRFQKKENSYNRFFDNEYLLPYPLWLFPIIFCLIKITTHSRYKIAERMMAEIYHISKNICSKCSESKYSF